MTLNVTSEQKAQGVFIVTVAGSLDSNTYKVLEDKVDVLLSESTEMIVSTSSISGTSAAPASGCFSRPEKFLKTAAAR